MEWRVGAPKGQPPEEQRRGQGSLPTCEESQMNGNAMAIGMNSPRMVIHIDKFTNTRWTCGGVEAPG